MVFGTLPLEVFYRKGGMLEFCKAFLQAGKTLPASGKIDVSNAFPRVITECVGIVQMTKHKRGEFSHEVDEVLKSWERHNV